MDTALLVLGVFVLLLNICGIVLDFTLNPIRRTVKYRLQRLSNWLVIGITYAFLYMGRYHLSVLNTDAYRSRLHISKQDLGWVFTLGYWAYSASLPFTGYIIANLNAKKVLVFGSLGSGLMNLLIGVIFYAKDGDDNLPGFPLLVLFVVLNFTLQGLCTSAIPQLNARWYRSKEAGNFSGVFSVLTSTGYFMALNIGAVIVESPHWWYFIFLAPALGLIVWNCVVWFVVCEPPLSVDNPLFGKAWTHKEDAQKDRAGYTQLCVEMQEMDHTPRTTTETPTTTPRTTATAAATTTTTTTPTTANTAVITTTEPTELVSSQDEHAPILTMSSNSLFDASAAASSNSGEENLATMITPRKPTILTFEQGGGTSVEKIEHKQAHAVDDLSITRKIMILVWNNNQSLGTIFFLGFAKESLLTWFPSFLEEVYNCPPTSTIYIVTSCGLTLASMFGSIIVGVISDKVFASRRNPVYILCAVFYTSSFVILAFVSNSIVACALLCFGGVWLLGSFSLVAFSAALDLNDKNDSAAVSSALLPPPPPIATQVDEKEVKNTKALLEDHSSLDDGTEKRINIKSEKKPDASKSVTFFSCMLGLFQYVGSGLSGILGAKIIDNAGYTAWCILLSAVSFASVLPVVLFSPTFIYYVVKAKTMIYRIEYSRVHVNNYPESL